MSELPKHKYDWFNTLPYTQRKTGEFVRECPCGKSIWYEQGGSVAVHSWIEIHYGHTKDDMLLKKPFEYDWSVAWRFSKQGFEELVKIMGLKFVCYSGDFKEFSDGKNRFAFAIFNTSPPNPQFPFENHYCTFRPDLSEIKL